MKPPRNIIRNFTIVLVVIVVIIFVNNELTVPLPGVPKFIDSMTCEVFIVDEDGNHIGIEIYDQECLDFKELPLSEQYEIYEQEKQDPFKQYEDDDPDTFLITSGSMRPTFDVYDSVRIDRNIPFEDIKIGDIIVLNRPFDHDRVIIHRVTSVIDHDPKILETKGDANPAPIPGNDFPISEEEYIGKVVEIIKFKK